MGKENGVKSLSPRDTASEKATLNMPIQIKSEPRDETFGSAVAGTESSGGEKNSGSGGGVDSGSSSSTPTPTATPTPLQPANNAISRPTATSNNQRSSSSSSSSSSTSRPTGSYGSSASHSATVGSGKASEKLSEEALEALEKRIDIASIKGVFGWTTIDGINIPFIFREDKKFVSVRIVEVKLFSRYPNSFPDELGKRDPLTSYFITEHEAKLLNEINTVHCSYEYGKQLFTTQDLIVNLLEFEQFHDVVKKSFPTEQQEDSRAQDMTLPRKSDRPQFMDYCGWLQINNTITPYVERSNGGKYVPLSVIRHAAGLLADNHITGDPPTKIECDMLNETCKVAGFNFSFCKSTKLVSLNTIKTYHNPLIINLPQDKPLTHARYIDFTGSTSKNSNFSQSPTLSAFPPPLQSSALSSTQAMHPFNPALPPYPRNPSPRGAPNRSAITNNLINSSIIMQGGLGSNFLNFAKQQMPLKVPSASDPPNLQQRASYGTSNSVLNNSRLQPDQANSNHHGVPNVGQLQQSKQHGGPLHVLKSFLNKGHVATQSLPSISQASPGQSVIQHQRTAHQLTSQPSQNVLVSQIPRFTSASITNPASLYASGGSLLSPLTPQSQWNAVIGSLPANFADMTRYTQANSTVRQPASSVSYPHPATNIPVTTTSSMATGHHPQNLYEQMLTISDSQSTLGALAGLWTRPSENSSVSQVAAAAAQASIPSPNVMVSSGSSKPLPRTLAQSVTSMGAVVDPNHNSITANSVVVPPSNVQPINLTSSSPVLTTNKLSQQQPVGGAGLTGTNPPEPAQFAPFSTPVTATTDQQPQQQRASKQADSALVQHISSIFLRGKSISCITSPSRSGSFALVEAVCKLYYPQCSMNEFLFALENVLKVPLTACTDEEEKAFIQYYSLPVSVLKCNKMIKLSTLESHFPQLTYMFCKGQDASNTTTAVTTTTSTTIASSSSTSSTIASSSTTLGLETNLLNATGSLDSEKNLRVSPLSARVNNDSPTAATATGLSSLALVTASSSLSSTNAALGPIIVENDEDDVVLDCSRKSSPVVVVGVSSLLTGSNPSNGAREGTPSSIPNSLSPPSSTPPTNNTTTSPSSAPGTLPRTSTLSPLPTTVAVSSSPSLLLSSSSSPSPERTTATTTPTPAGTANMSSLSSASSTSPSSTNTTTPPPPRFLSAASSPSNSSVTAASPPVSGSDPNSQQASVVTMVDKAKTGSVDDPSPSPVSTPTPPPHNNNNNSDGTYMAVPLMSLAEMQRLNEQQQKAVTNSPLASLKRPGAPIASGQSKFPCRSLEETVQRLHQTQNSPLTNATNMQICQTDSGK